MLERDKITLITTKTLNVKKEKSFTCIIKMKKLYFKMTVFSCQNVFKVNCVHYPINEYLTNIS